MEKLLNKIKNLIPRKIFKALQPGYHFFLSWISSLIYGRPSEKLIIIGVTGTTGKTTSTYLIAKAMESAGYKVGFTSTAVFNNGEKEWLNDKKMTMVGRFFTQKILKQMVEHGCQYGIVETTSEGIRQFRHRFINYDILVFTGLYPEHIESHGSFENYKKAKGKLFEHLARCKTKYTNEEKKIIKPESGIKKIGLERIKKTIIINGDDEHSEYFLNFSADQKILYTKSNKYDNLSEKFKVLKYSDVKADRKGTNFKINDLDINLNILGKFNAKNAMNAIAVALSQEIDLKKIKTALEKISGVAGRLEKIDEGQNFTVIVDYAFEPNAVEKLYETIKFIPHNKVIHVLGSAGGGRDIKRRPKLGHIAGEKADFVVVTNEDPYDEDPQIIINQVAFGAEKAGKLNKENLFKISDRREGIKKALDLAEEGDIVLITGKGSEQAICVAHGEKITWDDRAVVRGILNNEK